MYYYDPDITSPITNGSSSFLDGITVTLIWTILSLVLAVVGGIVLYFLFFKNDKEIKNPFLAWIKDFFNFHKMLIEDMLKVIYLVLAIYITLISFTYIFVNPLIFFGIIIFGNIGLRLIFELALVNIMIWKNTNEINKKMKK